MASSPTIQKVACDATPEEEGSAIFKTTERSEAAPTCDAQLAVGCETPIKVGCLLKQDQALRPSADGRARGGRRLRCSEA